jgi:feruloyl esterase
MGADNVHSFMRFYLVPGFGHGSGKFIAAWDPLTALENWVEKGSAPENLIVSDAGKDGAGRTRPMCEYPSYPKYKSGATDPSNAENFECAK